MGLRTAIYARISDDPEGLSLGVGRQVEDCTEDAEREDEEIVGIFIDNDLGASTHSKKPRPDYKRVIDLAVAGKIDVIRAYSNNRLTRRPLEVEDLIQLHERTGVRLRTRVSGEDDLSTADGRMVARIKAAVDAAEAERISERVRRKSLERARAGSSHGGQRVYGWQAENREMLDLAEHRVIREAVARALAGETLWSIVTDLNRRGITAATGGAWTVQSMKRMLLNPRLAGIRIHQGKPIGKGAWEPAVTELEHRMLIRALVTKERPPGATARRHLGSGLFPCADCKKPVELHTSSYKGSPTRQHYRCPECGMIRKLEWVDTYVDAVMTEFLRGYSPPPAVPVDPAAEREAENLRARIADTKAAFAESDTMTPADLDDVLRVLGRRLKDAERRATPPPAERLLDGLTGDAPARPWDEITLEQKRRIIDMFFTVELHRGRPGIRVFDPATVQFIPR